MGAELARDNVPGMRCSNVRPAGPTRMERVREAETGCASLRGDPRDRGLPADSEFDILTPGGTVTAHVLDADGAHIAMDMGDSRFSAPISASPARRGEVVDEEVTVADLRLRIVGATVGDPHCVVFLDAQTPEVRVEIGGLTAVLAHRLGPSLEHLPVYPKRTNVQFAQVMDRHTLRIEIWERGAEYTLASGTSSCVVGGVAIRTGRCASPVTVQTPGGEMRVEVRRTGRYGDGYSRVRVSGEVAVS